MTEMSWKLPEVWRSVRNSERLWTPQSLLRPFAQVAIFGMDPLTTRLTMTASTLLLGSSENTLIATSNH